MQLAATSYLAMRPAAVMSGQIIRRQSLHAIWIVSGGHQIQWLFIFGHILKLAIIMDVGGFCLADLEIIG